MDKKQKKFLREGRRDYRNARKNGQGLFILLDLRDKYEKKLPI